MKHINLLPKDKQKEIAHEILFRGVVRFWEVAFVTFLLVFAAQFVTWSYLRANEAGLDNKIEQIKKVSNKEENAKLKEKIREINGHITDFKNLIDGSPTWSVAVRRIAMHVPEGVKINTVVADTKTKKLEIRGYSPTRESVLDFYNAVRNDTDHFASINYPLENVAKPVDVSFIFTIELKDVLLKKSK
jgi:Tfp pilus assembly protein PilN